MTSSSLRISRLGPQTQHEGDHCTTQGKGSIGCVFPSESKCGDGRSDSFRRGGRARGMGPEEGKIHTPIENAHTAGLGVTKGSQNKHTQRLQGRSSRRWDAHTPNPTNEGKDAHSPNGGIADPVVSKTGAQKNNHRFVHRVASLQAFKATRKVRNCTLYPLQNIVIADFDLFGVRHLFGPAWKSDRYSDIIRTAYSHLRGVRTVSQCQGGGVAPLVARPPAASTPVQNARRP